MYSILRENEEETRQFSIPHGRTWLIQGREYYGRRISVVLECYGQDKDGRKCQGKSKEELFCCPTEPTAKYGAHLDVFAVCQECGAHLWAIVQLYEILPVVSADVEEEVIRADERAYNKALDDWKRRHLFQKMWDWTREKKFVPPSRFWNEKNAFSPIGMNRLYYVVSIKCSVEGCFGSTHPIAIEADQDNLINEAGACNICGATIFTWIRIERYRG